MPRACRRIGITRDKAYAIRFESLIRPRANRPLAALQGRRACASKRKLHRRRIKPSGGISMATYIVLSNFTDQGIRNVKETTKRSDAVRELARKMGIETKSLYWTVGKYDVVVTFEAPDDAAMTALCLAIGAQGNVRTQTLRAFSKDEMSNVLGKLG
jgi:uncharacterized protein with GYD domain